MLCVAGGGLAESTSNSVTYFDTVMLEKIALGCWKNVLGKRKKTAKAPIGLVRAALHNPAFSLFPNFQKNFSASGRMGDCGADFLKPMCRGQWNCVVALVFTSLRFRVLATGR